MNWTWIGFVVLVVGLACLVGGGIFYQTGNGMLTPLFGPFRAGNFLLGGFGMVAVAEFILFREMMGGS